MSMNQIAVVGCGGMIGEVVCRNLCKDFSVKGGQRRKPTELLKLNNFKWCYLDIFDSNSLYEFCKDCTIIINCAGPETVIKDAVAKEAMLVGAKYIDVSSAMLLNQKEIDNLATNGENYVGAGFYPGITGLLLRRVFNLLDKTNNVNCYVGGSESYTKTSISDILTSAYGAIGETDSYWKDKDIKSEKINIMKKEFVPEIDDPVYKRPYLSREILDILKRNPIQELHWYNIAPNDLIFRLAVQFNQIRLESSVEEAIEQLGSSLDYTLEDEWIALVIVALGVKNGKSVKNILTLRMKTSFELTGNVAAEVARLTYANTRPKGIYWAHEVLPLDFMEKYIFSKDTDYYEEKVIDVDI